MTWTTSADPWANGIRKDAASAPLQMQIKALHLFENSSSATVPALAAAHLCLLVVLMPGLADPAAISLLLASGLALLAAAVATIRVRQLDAIEAAVPPHASADHPLHRDPADHVPGAHPLPAERAAASEIILPAPQQVMRANAHNQDWADLMARVSHELRTPLNAVLGFSDLMDRGLYGPLGHQRYQEYARHIHESGRDLLKSAEDTLAVTSLLTAPSRHAPTEVVDLADLTADAWAFFGKLPQSKAVSLATEIPAGTEIMCERRSMRQVLVNLLSEALTRSRPGTTVTLHASLACGQIGLQVAVPFADNQSQREPGSLDVCLARTLLEFHGTTLSEHLSEQAGWRATTYLERADQADFFAPAIPAARPLYVFA